MNKKKGYIIYLDVLGYRNIIASRDLKEIEQLRLFLSSLSNSYFERMAASNYGPEYDKSKLLIRCYSDNVLLFYESEQADPLSLALAIFLANSIVGPSIQKGFMLRGSVVFGELEYTENLVFGSAIIEAYTLESGHAEPSVVLSKELKAVYEQEKLFQEDLLSPFTIDQPSDYEIGKKYALGMKVLVNRLNKQSFVEERTLAKYRWLVNEYNRYFKNYCRLDFVESPSHYEIEYSDSSLNV